MSNDKQFPKVSSDEELEKFVDEADLKVNKFAFICCLMRQIVA